MECSSELQDVKMYFLCEQPLTLYLISYDIMVMHMHTSTIHDHLSTHEYLVS